jgi:hypothetical protein
VIIHLNVIQVILHLLNIDINDDIDLGITNPNCGYSSSVTSASSSPSSCSSLYALCSDLEVKTARFDDHFPFPEALGKVRISPK